MLKFAACVAALSLSFTATVCLAQTKSDPLQGAVKKSDQLPTRLARPQLPTLNGKVSDTAAVDTGSFDLKQQAPKSVPASADWNGMFEQPQLKSVALPAKKAEDKPASTTPDLAEHTERSSVDKNGEPQDPWAAELAIIGNYNVIALIDRSASMAIADCDGVSRWEWCENETRSFATITSSVMKSGIDLTLFSESFDNVGVVSANQLHTVFSNNEPYRGTILSPPLANCVGRARYSLPKKAIIVVITDGEPQDKRFVQNVLIQSTKDFPQGYVKVVFLKVGEGFEGADFVHYLDYDLVRQGAVYDIVESRDFNYLRTHGLLRTLCDVVTGR